MKNKILFINGGVKEFGNRFRKACNDKGIEHISIRTHHNSYILVDGNSSRYFHLGEEVNFEEFQYAFIRVRGKKSHMTALLCLFLDLYEIKYNDRNNIEHTQNDDKITQMVAFSNNKIPIPKTIICGYESYEKNKESIKNHIQYPCVLKTYGSKGDFVWKIEKDENILERMSQVDKELFLIQELIPNSYDIRALIFENRLLGAIERKSKDGFYNNVSKGGDIVTANLTEDELNLCNKAMNTVRLDFGGVDFIRTDKGLIFWEINKGPQVYGLEGATGYNIPNEIVKIIKIKYLD